VARGEREAASHAESAEEVEVVRDGPVLGDLAVLEAAQGDAGQGDGAALVRAVRLPARGDAVAARGLVGTRIWRSGKIAR
jgi:hypothetical protein